MMANIRKTDGKAAGLGCQWKKLLRCIIGCCTIRLRGFSSSSFGIPSLSRWRFKKRHRFFFGISVALLAGLARLCPQKVPVSHVFLHQMLDQ